MVKYHRMYQKKGRKITFFTHLPQCSMFFRFYIINSRHSPTDKIKGFYSADRKWKLTAAKSLGPCGSTRLESANSGKHRSKVKMWANHGVCHNYIYWNYAMRRYSFNPRFFYESQWNILLENLLKHKWVWFVDFLDLDF